jgi:hypothetical protein
LQHLRCYQSSGALLEIGCAYVFFLLEAREFFQVKGIEISPSRRNRPEAVDWTW